MEVDPNLLAADCVVICTCCPCLVLQLLVLLLLRLPCKLAKRSKRLVLRRLRRKRPRAARPGRRELPAELVVVAEAHAHPGARVQMGAPEAVLSAIAEAERVLAQLYEEGELGFGSFWRRGPGGGSHWPTTTSWAAVAAAPTSTVFKSCTCEWGPPGGGGIDGPDCWL